jgi:glycosyltransferase involved in cell wall biosynthesis
MISVVMPAYNASKFIALAIESILNQTFQEFELIIVDDGSTDNTSEIIGRYVEQDNRIRAIQNEHGGISYALNTGISESRYPWVAIIHADDIALPKRFEKQINAAKANPKVVVWGTYAYHINSKGDILSVSRVGPTTEKEFYDLRRKGQVVLVIHPTALLKKEVVLEAGGYDSRFDGSEEMELFDRLAEYGPILSLPESLLLYRIHCNSVSMQRFFTMRRFNRYIRARHKTRLADNRIVSFDEFLEEYKRQPLSLRLRKYIDDWSQFFYRRAGLSFGEKQYLRACLFFAISVTLNPRYSIPRIWNQMISPEARRWLKSKK